ncbi:MAG: ABC transporter permease [Peptococcaceae bacterium]|jgi:peptide/nickel transport system permease protein/oligopeptide transport system permease protein|nr:ABC transporter permease [Peptococcaceae bacterium]
MKLDDNKLTPSAAGAGAGTGAEAVPDAALYADEDADAELLDDDGIFDHLKSMLRKNKLAAFSLLVILIFAGAAALAPLIAPYNPNTPVLSERFAPPSLAHWLGCDELGRDAFSRLLYGTRVSMMIGLVPTTISMVFGTLLGLFAGYYGGKVDFTIMRFADIVLAFPSLLLAMVVMYTLGGSLMNIFIALSIVKWAGTARVIRAQTMSLKEKEFVEAARSMGVKRWVIMFRHILPNCIPNLIVLFTLNIPESILSESSLSFLGIGAQPPSTSWGLMVYRSKSYLFSQPWLAIAPGVVILIFVLAFNFLGDGVRDAMDPYLKD